jgi:protoheme ferro-lyase
MATRMISIRKFRENMPTLLKEAKKKKMNFLLMRHSVPVARVEPIEEDPELEALIAQAERARKDYREGKTYTMEEVAQHLGLKSPARHLRKKT